MVSYKIIIRETFGFLDRSAFPQTAFKNDEKDTSDAIFSNDSPFDPYKTYTANR